MRELHTSLGLTQWNYPSQFVRFLDECFKTASILAVDHSGGPTRKDDIEGPQRGVLEDLCHDPRVVALQLKPFYS